MNTIIFSHGKESGPYGTKITQLIEVGNSLQFQSKSIDYRKCEDVNERVELLKENISNSNDEKIILVGSSMGGYVSTVVASEVKIDGLFLMCPALYLPRYDIQNYTPKTKHIEIIHGWNDDIVPHENSIRFGKMNSATLHLVNDNHRLSESHDFLKYTFLNFLQKIK